MAIDRIRFHLDEQVNPAIADALRRLDIDVTTTNDVQLRTHTDTVHWEYAQRESRVIVTHDVTFSVSRASMGVMRGSYTAIRRSVHWER